MANSVPVNFVQTCDYLTTCDPDSMLFFICKFTYLFVTYWRANRKQETIALVLIKTIKFVIRFTWLTLLFNRLCFKLCFFWIARPSQLLYKNNTYIPQINGRTKSNNL